MVQDEGTAAMKTMAILAQKGGSGKTTITVHMAVCNAGVDLTIIDTAPHSSADAAIAAKLADFVLIPCRPARFDLDAVASTLEIAKAANTPAAVVINAASTRGPLAKEARAALSRQGAIVIDTVLHQRVAYSHAVIDGRSVHEYEPGGAAAGEIDQLYNHITRLYGKAERKSKAA